MALFWVQLQSGCKVNIVHNKYLNVTIERDIYIYINHKSIFLFKLTQTVVLLPHGGI